LKIFNFPFLKCNPDHEKNFFVHFDLSYPLHCRGLHFCPQEIIRFKRFIFSREPGWTPSIAGGRHQLEEVVAGDRHKNQ